MDPEYSRIIGLEVVTDNLFETFTIDIGISPLCFGFDSTP